MHDPYECPECDAHRDSPTAACDRCGFDPCPAPADDRALDAFERTFPTTETDATAVAR